MVPKRPANSIQEILAEGRLLCYVGASGENIRETQKKLKQIQKKCGKSSISETLSCLEEAGAYLDENSFAALLRWCGFCKSLADGKSVHYHIVKSGLSRSRFLQNHLVQMYGNCGELDKAFSIFSRMRIRDVFSWSFMIKACVQHGQGTFAADLFEQMQQESILPDSVLLINALPACSNIIDSKKLHARLVGCGNEADVSAGTTLIKVYGKYGQVEQAREVFDSMVDRDTVFWTAMIAVYAQNKLAKDALVVFSNMCQSSIESDDVTFLSVLSACASQGYLLEGMKIHAFIIDTSFDSKKSLQNALLHLYSKCGALDDVQKMFRNVDEHDDVSWTAVIAAYAQHSLVLCSVQAFDQMHQEGALAVKTTYMAVICAFDNSTVLQVGAHMHARIAYFGLNSDVTMCNALISMYGKCGSMEKAFEVFEDMLEKDVFSWNAMIHVFAKHKRDKKALHFFAQMHSEGMFPDAITFIRVVDSLSGASTLKEGKRTHAYLLSTGLGSNVVVATALVNMYKNCGNMKFASLLFYEMSERDTVAWNAFIEANAQNINGKVALQMYEQMQQEGVLPEKPTYVSVLSTCANYGVLAECKWTHARAVGRSCVLDLVLGNALLNTYAKCGNVDAAWRLFQELSVRDIFSWNTIIAAYAQSGQGKLAVQMLPSMEREGIAPNAVTFVSILSACSHAGLINEASQYLVSMEQDYGLKATVEHHNCMIDLLGRTGCLGEAEKWMQEMLVEATSVSWLILLNACKQYTDVKRGERAAEHCFRLDPQDVTPYVLLSNIYAAAGREGDAAAIIRRMLDNGLRLSPGHPLSKTVQVADKDASNFEPHCFEIESGC